jgi:hypothetical protein
MYISSSIKLQPSGLYKATITTSWFYFGTQDEHATFLTIGSCRDWLISKRCENLVQETEPQKDFLTPIVPEAPKPKAATYAEMVKENPKLTKVKGPFIC